MTAPLLVLGSGGHAREVIATAEAMNRECCMWEILGFLDDNSERHGLTVAGYPVLGGSETFAGRGIHVMIGVGNTQVRRTIALRLEQLGYRFATLIHPTAVLGPRIKIGPGTVIFPNATLTVDIELGDHVAVNTAASVSHDCQIGNFVNLSPGSSLCGSVTIGEGTDIGAGAVVVQGQRVGSWSVLGAGAVVISHIEDRVVAVGVPAIVKRTNSV
ncbi:MAG TPA: acetyltransferase [Symbiobacteriaceae bacterium]|jgi:sugar O-acyltransferase (sialic acid O-acetyltransferase NeuD family)